MNLRFLGPGPAGAGPDFWIQSSSSTRSPQFCILNCSVYILNWRVLSVRSFIANSSGSRAAQPGACLPLPRPQHRHSRAAEAVAFLVHHGIFLANLRTNILHKIESQSISLFMERITSTLNTLRIEDRAPTWSKSRNYHWSKHAWNVNKRSERMKGWKEKPSWQWNSRNANVIAP